MYSESIHELEIVKNSKYNMKKKFVERVYHAYPDVFRKIRLNEMDNSGIINFQAANGVHQDIYVLATENIDENIEIELKALKVEQTRYLNSQKKVPEQVNNYIQNQVQNQTQSQQQSIDVQFKDTQLYLVKCPNIATGELQLILGKLNELEEILKSSTNRIVKWEKAKRIFSWALDKGIDVAIAFLPYITHIGK